MLSSIDILTEPDLNGKWRDYGRTGGVAASAA
jgi:hypothetical protein